MLSTKRSQDISPRPLNIVAPKSEMKVVPIDPQKKDKERAREILLGIQLMLAQRPY